MMIEYKLHDETCQVDGARSVEAERRTYRRARTREQKAERLDDILDVTEELLDEGSYRDVTMSSIADRLGYSRTNLSHYVGSKEEILLLLYVRSLRGMLEDLESVGANGALSADAAPSAVAAAVANHRDFGRIGALLSSLVETNVSLECLTRCKMQIMDVLASASALLVQMGALCTKEQAIAFLLDLANYVAGLYPAAHPLPVQIEAARAVGYPVQSYEASLARYIGVQLVGYRALTREG